MKRPRIPALLLALCMMLSIGVPAVAAESNTTIQDDAGNVYTLDKPYLSSQTIDVFEKTATQYTLQQGTTVTAPDGVQFTTWFGASILFPDSNGGGPLEAPVSAIVPETGWEHEYQTDAGSTLYVKIDPEAPFDDVAVTDFFCAPVIWAVGAGVTNGTTETTFGPLEPCMQSQILTFLWRAAESPEPTIVSPYTDPTVTEDQYYYQAMVWAYEKGLVLDDGLQQSAPCTRGDVVLYLWRLSGSPETAPDARFADVPADAEYASAVAWAVESGITNGTSDTTFEPDKVCNRGEIVTFLYRYFIS